MGNDESLPRVALWDGLAWQPVGGGLGVGQLSESPQGLDFSEFGDGLIAVGKFGVAGNSPARSVARWDGLDWSALDGPFIERAPSSPVEKFIVLEQGLLVAGAFRFAGETQANALAFWDGVNWSSFGSGADGDDPIVRDIDLIGSDLWAVGAFNGIDGAPARNAAYASGQVCFWRRNVI